MRYSQTEHEIYSDDSYRSAKKILAYLLDLFKPNSYLELGAGFCHWSRVAMDYGIDDVLAVDGPWTNLSAIHIDRSKFFVQDMEQEFDLGRRFDMALTLEVGEHISESSADIFVRTLTRHSDLIVFGAAIPLQGGFRHINEQWQSYWLSRFRSHGFRAYDIIRPRFWDDREIPYYYRQNPFLFIKSGRRELTTIADEEMAKVQEQYPIVDLVHPDKYIEMAQYDIISLRRLASKLPMYALRATAQKARRILTGR